MAVTEAMWTIEDALDFVRSMVGLLRTVGYCVAMTGSVLIDGESRKDLDIVLYPLSTGDQDQQAARDVLHIFGMNLLFDRKEVQHGWQASGSTDTKHVEVWSVGGKRVDVFFLA